MEAFSKIEVIHAWPDPKTRVMRCCGLHMAEAVQSDRATLVEANVTCDGTKRHRKDRPGIVRQKGRG